MSQRRAGVRAVGSRRAVTCCTYAWPTEAGWWTGHGLTRPCRRYGRPEKDRVILLLCNACERMMHEPKETDVHRLASIWEVGRRLVGVCTWRGHGDWQRPSTCVQKVIIVLPSQVRWQMANMRGNFGRSGWVTVPSFCRRRRKRKGKLRKRTFSCW